MGVCYLEIVRVTNKVHHASLRLNGDKTVRIEFLCILNRYLWFGTHCLPLAWDSVRMCMYVP